MIPGVAREREFPSGGGLNFDSVFSPPIGFPDQCSRLSGSYLRPVAVLKVGGAGIENVRVRP